MSKFGLGLCGLPKLLNISIYVLFEQRSILAGMELNLLLPVLFPHSLKIIALDK
jgi:hypothetical protein